MNTQTHTYALVEVSKRAYKEIYAKLKDAGYQHAFNDEGEIDMNGLALVRKVKDKIQNNLALARGRLLWPFNGPRQPLGLDNYKDIALLRELIQRNGVATAAAKTKRHGKHWEIVIGIGKDETAFITLTDDALEAL